MKTDVLIVGQGIAGSLLAYFLLKAGHEVVVVDHSHKGAASAIAAGIINPVTGRRFVKSWRVDEFFPFATKTYREIGEKAGQSFIANRNILWALNDNQQQNDWYARKHDAGYEKFIRESAETGGINAFCHSPFCWVELEGAAHVDLPGIIRYFTDLLNQQKVLLSEDFDFDQLHIVKEEVHYKEITAKKIIFCEGHRSSDNPFFNSLPHQPAKGDILLLRIPGFESDKMIKSGIFLVPMGNQHFWAGSSYIWNFDDDQPTATGKSYLKKQLEKLIKVPYEILAHKAAIRPVFRSRRPIIGMHPEFYQVGIFNGLGTKGASLAPFWANHFTNYLTGKIDKIDPDVDLGNYQLSAKKSSSD